MTGKSLHLLMCLGTGLVLATGCGDNGGVTAGNTDSTGDTSEDTTSPTAPTNPTSTPTTTATETAEGGMEASIGSTLDTTGETEATGDTSVVEDTSTGDTSTSTGDTSTGDTSTGDTSTGDTSTGDTSTGDTSTSTGDMTTGDTEDTTTGDADLCLLAVQHLPCDADSNEPLHALGINCTSLGGMWVNNDNAVSVTNYDFQAPAPFQGKRTWQTAKSYGTYINPKTQKPYWSAREGEKLLMISSGLLPSPDNQGAVIIEDGDVYNDTTLNQGIWDTNGMPPPMSQKKGSPDIMGFTNCDKVNDCSNTLKAQWDLGNGNPEDKMWFSFKMTAPAIANGDVADANGYTFDFAYFSAEFPEFVDTGYNDIFVVWQSSEDYTGNVTFINGQPMTVTALWPIDFQGDCGFLDPNCQGQDPHLEGTGYIEEGGATNWYKAIGGVKPGETFLLAFAIFDMGDSSYDTTALIDNWQWDCEGCVPNEVDNCGITPDPM